MNISFDAAGFLILLAGAIGGIFKAYRVSISMQQNIKTLFLKVEEIKKEKDSDIEKLNLKIDSIHTEIKSFKDSQNEQLNTLRMAHTDAITNLASLMNERHIELIEKIAEARK